MLLAPVKGLGLDQRGCIGGLSRSKWVVDPIRGDGGFWLTAGRSHVDRLCWHYDLSVLCMFYAWCFGTAVCGQVSIRFGSSGPVVGSTVEVSNRSVCPVGRRQIGDLG